MLPSALRGTSGGASMTTPGGAGISCSTATSSVLDAPASLIGSELPWLTGSGLYNACNVGRVVLGYWVILHQRGLRFAPPR
jgi:hypothetical protein